MIGNWQLSVIIQVKAIRNGIGIQISKFFWCPSRVQNFNVCLRTKQRLTKIAIFPGKYKTDVDKRFAKKV